LRKAPADSTTRSCRSALGDRRRRGRDVADADAAALDRVVGVDDVDIIARSSVSTADSGSSGASIEPARISAEAKPPGRSSRL
jgi:hypothetical protein